MKYTFLFIICVVGLGIGYLALSEIPAPTVAVEKEIPNSRFFDE